MIYSKNNGFLFRKSQKKRPTIKRTSKIHHDTQSTNGEALVWGPVVRDSEGALKVTIPLIAGIPGSPPGHPDHHLSPTNGERRLQISMASSGCRVATRACSVVVGSCASLGTEGTCEPRAETPGGLLPEVQVSVGVTLGNR